MRICSPERKVV